MKISLYHSVLVPCMFFSLPALAECRSPMLNMGSVVSTDHATLHFARIVNGIMNTTGAQSVQGNISGCDETGRYRLRVATQTPVTMDNKGNQVNVHPILVAVNEMPLPVAIDLTRGTSPVFTGNPSVRVVFALSGSKVEFNPGVYNGTYMIEFQEQ